MKITNSQLKQIMKEEFDKVLSEYFAFPPFAPREKTQQLRQKFKDEDEAYSKLKQKYGEALFGASKEELMTLGHSEKDVDKLLSMQKEYDATKKKAEELKIKADKAIGDNEKLFELLKHVFFKIKDLEHQKILAKIKNDPKSEKEADSRLNNFQKISLDIQTLGKEKKWDEIFKKYFNFIKENKQ